MNCESRRIPAAGERAFVHYLIEQLSRRADPAFSQAGPPARSPQSAAFRASVSPSESLGGFLRSVPRFFRTPAVDLPARETASQNRPQDRRIPREAVTHPDEEKSSLDGRNYRAPGALSSLLEASPRFFSSTILHGCFFFFFFSNNLLLVRVGRRKGFSI